jgi:hypothetical protein
VDYAAVRSGPSDRLRITADTASSAVCGAPHTAEFERELIVERTKAGLASARARGRNGGRPFKMTIAKLRLAQAAMGQPGTRIGELCIELGVSRQTLYRHMNPPGQLRPDGEKLLGRKRRTGSNGTERSIQKGDRVERSGR